VIIKLDGPHRPDSDTGFLLGILRFFFLPALRGANPPRLKSNRLPPRKCFAAAYSNEAKCQPSISKSQSERGYAAIHAVKPAAHCFLGTEAATLRDVLHRLA
jgi:hypothetical protein